MDSFKRGRTGRSSGNEIDSNCLEMIFSHMLIHPRCSGCLLMETEMAPAHTKLAVPRFVMPETHENGDNVIQPPSKLSAEELDGIARRSRKADGRRRDSNPRV